MAGLGRNLVVDTHPVELQLRLPGEPATAELVSWKAGLVENEDVLDTVFEKVKRGRGARGTGPYDDDAWIGRHVALDSS